MNENYYLLKSDAMVKGLDFYCESEGFNSSHLQPIWICLISLFNLGLVMLLNLKPSLIEGCLSKPCDAIFLILEFVTCQHFNAKNLKHFHILITKLVTNDCGTWTYATTNFNH
jgi:hypothetical protein